MSRCKSPTFHPLTIIRLESGLWRNCSMACAIWLIASPSYPFQRIHCSPYTCPRSPHCFATDSLVFFFLLRSFFLPAKHPNTSEIFSPDHFPVNSFGKAIHPKYEPRGQERSWCWRPPQGTTT